MTSTPAARTAPSETAPLAAVWLASAVVLAACLLAGFRMDFAGDVESLLRANGARVLLAAGAGAALALSGALRLASNRVRPLGELELLGISAGAAGGGFFAAERLSSLPAGPVFAVGAALGAGLFLAAARWKRRAAHAATLRDPDTAIEHWRRIRRLLADCNDPEALDLGSEACREFLFASWRVGVPEEEWRDAYREGLELGRTSGDAAGVARVLSAIAGTRGFDGEHRAQVELTEEALELARESGDFALEASLYQRIGWAHGLAGNNRAQLEWTERGIEFCRPTPERAGAVSGFSTWPWLLCQRGWALFTMGRFDEAESMLRQGEARAEAANDELTLGYAFYGHHVIAWLRGDLEALDQLAQQVDSNADYPPGMIRYMKLTALAETALERGDHAKAISVFESLWISGSDPGRIAVFQADRALDLARAYCAHGDREAALREVGVAEELFRTRPELWDSMPFLIIDLARIRLALHGAEAAEEMIALLDRRIATMEARGWGGYLPLTLWIRAQAADLLGDVAAAKRDLRAAREGYQAMEAPRRVAQADAELAALA